MRSGDVSVMRSFSADPFLTCSGPRVGISCGLQHTLKAQEKDVLVLLDPIFEELSKARPRVFGVPARVAWAGGCDLCSPRSHLLPTSGLKG